MLQQRTLSVTPRLLLNNGKATDYESYKENHKLAGYSRSHYRNVRRIRLPVYRGLVVLMADCVCGCAYLRIQNRVVECNMHTHAIIINNI